MLEVELRKQKYSSHSCIRRVRASTRCGIVVDCLLSSGSDLQHEKGDTKEPKLDRVGGGVRKKWSIYLVYCLQSVIFTDTIYKNHKVKRKPQTQAEIITIVFLVGVGGVTALAKGSELTEENRTGLFL